MALTKTDYELIVEKIQEMTLQPPDDPMNTHDFLIWVQGYSSAVTNILDLVAEIRETFMGE